MQSSPIKPVNAAHIVLLGDSIFDNAAYVGDGKPVAAHLADLLGEGWQISLLAVDGDITSQVHEQLAKLPDDAGFLVLSSGGNDALRAMGRLIEPVETVEQALAILSEMREDFRADYRKVLAALKAVHHPEDGPSRRVAVCTVYDQVPNLSANLSTALALFNEVILFEAAYAGFTIIDLRLLCRDASDYSSVSPIEPSHSGGLKIAQAIAALLPLS
ncbi:SGNH/GDSL hydrolase family protein [Chitinimonas sp.]|uniref:SGNH/GDSL hydrolase family protein n=1 Tax=Chitinimonas sp. TaxID=1934313 RepID=UPI0035B030C6